jgi:hypothetical protein
MVLCKITQGIAGIWRKWCGLPRQQHPRGSKTNVLNEKNRFSVLNKISVIEPNKRKYSYNCDFLRV